jgi:hypothetical protein
MAEWSPMDLLPGLWVGFLVLLLRAALRRWYDPVPDRVLAAFGFALILLFGPVLFGGQILLPLDNLRGHAPFQDLPPTEPHGNILQGDLIELTAPSLVAVRSALDLRRWPLWNPHVGAGMPLLADPQAQAFQPLQLLAYGLPWTRAAGAVAALRVLSALVFTFLWMRRQGLGAGPATAGAFAYGLGGFVVLWVGWPIANPAALLPLGLYAVALCRQRGERRDLLLLTLGGFSLFLGGHPETVLYAFGLLLAVLAAQSFDGSDGTPVGLRLRRLRASLLALGTAGLIAAPVLLPTIEYLPETLRASRLDMGDRSFIPKPGVRAWLQIAAPNAFGNSRFVDYWGLNNTNEDAAGFVGTATLLAALLALPAITTGRRFPRERLFLGVAVVVLAVLALPGASRRPLLLLALALAYLGACTLERFRRGETAWRPVLVVLLVAAGLAAVIAWGTMAHPDPQDPERLAILRFGWLRWQMRFLVLAVLFLALARGRRWMPPAVAGLIAAELLLAHKPANPPMPQRLALPRPPAVKFLQDHLKTPEDGRMAALGRAFPPNLPLLWKLADARVYNPMAPRAYMDFTAPVTAAWWGEVPEWGRPRNPLYRRLGVRYILTGPDEILRPPLREVFADATARIWEVPEPQPIFSLEPDARLIERETDRPEEPQWLRFDAELPDERRLETSVFQDGHWSVFADGRLLPPEPGDGPFVAARLPAGTRKVDLVYRPGSFMLGCVLAAVGLAITALIAVPPPAGRR